MQVDFVDAPIVILAVPFKHLIQVDAWDAPTSAEYVPFKQLEHDDAPASVL